MAAAKCPKNKLDTVNNLPHQYDLVNNKKEVFMKQLQTISGEALMSQPLQPMNFVVDTLLSQGLHILAGSPKAGKSWLALWLAVTVARGEEVWKMSVKQGTTLYLCLEDSQLRIQNRLFDITDDAPPSELLLSQPEFIGTPAELSNRIDPAGTAGITPKKVARQILQSVDALREIGITATTRRSNGKRIIELHSAESVDSSGTQIVGTIDPAGTVTACPPM